MPTSEFTRRPWRPARLMVWVGLLCLLTQFSTVAHMALIEHVHCAEHGALVHGSEPHTERHQALDGEGLASGDQPDSETHDHDHCPALLEHLGSVTVIAAGSEIRLAGFDAVEPVILPGALPPRSLYGLAPKTSPPV